VTLGINKGIDAATNGRKKPEDKDLSAEQQQCLKYSANTAERMGRFCTRSAELGRRGWLLKMFGQF